MMKKKDMPKTNGSCVGKPVSDMDETSDMMTEKSKVSESRIEKKSSVSGKMSAGKIKKTSNGSMK